MAAHQTRDLVNTSKSQHLDTVACDVSQHPCVASELAPPGSTTKTRGSTKCCPRRGRRMKVSPADLDGTSLVEIRPGRCLHILHVNPRPRDAEIPVKPGLNQCSTGGRNRKIQKVDILHGAGDATVKNKGTVGNVSLSSEAGNTSPHKNVCVNHDTVQPQMEPPHEQFTTDTGVDMHIVGETNYAQDTAALYADAAQNTDVIFFIHGVGGSANVWKSQIDYFGAAGYEIIAPDLIGHGFSCAPRESKAYRFVEILLDIYVIFDKYCKQRNIVIGHSYGASFAAVLARERHHRVSRLVMISGGAPTPLGPQPGIFSMPTCLLNCCQPLMLRVFRKNAFHKESKICIPQEHAFDIPSYVLKYTMNGQIWAHGDDAYHEGIDVFTLLIHGRDDHLVSVDEEQDMVEAIAGSQMVILDGASHMVMLERTREVNHILRNFIKTGIPLITEEGNRWPVDISHGESPDVQFKGVNLTMKLENS